MIRKRAYAKFDLGIAISPEKAADGYYPVYYIDCQIDLYDELTFELQEGEIKVVCSDTGLPTDERNFVFKAAQLLKNFVGDDRLGVKISLEKNIPVKAGFGGGSSDAAAAVMGLSELWGIKISDRMVLDLSKELGKDFFYSIYGGLSEVVGVGKNYQITSLPYILHDFWLVIVVPDNRKPSTGWVYDHLKLKNAKLSSHKFEKLKKYLAENDRIGTLKYIRNDFEESALHHFPIVKKLKDDLTRAGAKATLMAGAGLSTVGFFNSKKEAKACLKALKGEYKQIFVSKIIN